MREFNYKVIKDLGVISESGDYVKKVCLISFNDRNPKIDIRSWKGDQMCKGIPLSHEEAAVLRDILQSLEL
ncbi:hypothetical protein AAK979_05335 [Ileibacterium valens]|uniref:YdbC family protein n=1 Tax=Ileibacterium valens TaxID=1862668 RepID=UPI003519D4E3